MEQNLSPLGNYGLHFQRAPFCSPVFQHEYIYQGGTDYAPFWEPGDSCALGGIRSYGITLCVRRTRKLKAANLEE
jgi:hypothetical protein